MGTANQNCWVLAGDWLVRAAGHGEWRTAADRGLDESGWQATPTVRRWWMDADLAGESAVLYRRHFELPPELAAELGGADSTARHDARWWFVASGLCDLGHLWLDEAYLGDLRGRHFEHAFEVSHLLRSSSDHLAAVEASRGAAHAASGAGSHLRISKSGPARIARSRALVIEASYDRAVLRVSATVDSSGTHRAEVTTTVLPIDDPDAGWSEDPTRPLARLGDGLAVSEPVLARGQNDLVWLVALEGPALWWPAGMGDQEQYCINIDVSIDGRSSHAVRLRTGVRTAVLRSGELYVNGESCGGRPGEVAAAQHDLADRGTYDDADAAGTMLCQQIALDPNVYAGAERGLRALAARAAASAADHAGHHPSVVSWQPLPPPGRRQWPRAFSPWAYRSMASAMRAADPTRPVLPPDRR
ncbi:hypothetical protein [Candidatus Poriferisodalis sp.]|uniref:hypothetical protein n=1 Tax=Candidatus Poriferisodalis sp. TaxID=3101277 RepID=UPI003B01F83A